MESSQSQQGGRSFLRSAIPAVLIATGVFALGVAAGTGTSLLPKGLIAEKLEPLHLDGDSIPRLRQPTTLELVSEGDERAINELRKKKPEELSVAETIALDGVERHDAQSKVRTLGRLIQTKRPDELPKEKIAEMIDYVGEEKTYRAALEELAKIPNFLGADLIHRASRTHRRNEAVGKLALRLLSTDEVRNRASPAMSVVIDAMNAVTCEEARDVLKRAAEDGDRRSFQYLARFGERVGCGPKKIDDCYKCLRVDRLLVDSVRLVQERIEPY